jgi:hypothetical protein
MKTRKKQATGQKADLTVEGKSLTVFTDSVRDGRATTSKGVVTSFDPAVAAFESLTRTLEDCLRTAQTIKNKRATELVKLLRVARRQVGALGTK